MKKKLFVCIENSCLSQMAEAFARLQQSQKFDLRESLSLINIL